MPPLDVRTGKQLSANFLVLAGQRDVEFRRGFTAPLTRLNPKLDAVALLEPGYDLVHVFNAIPLLMPKRFIVTFEDYLPRVPPDRPSPRLERVLTRKLLSRRCEALLAMSQYARRQFTAQHGIDPRLDHLLAKVHVVYPGVVIREHQGKKFRAGTPLTLLAVGNDWMRKGFPAVLIAHQLLKARGVPVQTTLVSNLRWSPKDYVGPVSASVRDEYAALLALPGVAHVSGVPNHRVRQLMSEAHFLVHPTFHDTFGYVGIEALAVGTPVLATNTCAMPEIVGPDGPALLIPFDNDAIVGKWRWLYRKDQPGYVESFRHQTQRSAEFIADAAQHAFETVGELARLSANAVQHARVRFDMHILRGILEGLYFGAAPRIDI